MWSSIRAWIRLNCLGEVAVGSIWEFKSEKGFRVKITDVSPDRIRYTYLPYRIAESSLTKNAFHFVYKYATDQKEVVSGSKNSQVPTSWP